ncbi:MAG: cytochrome c3 family protein [Actinomycetota bacterium]
MRTRFAALAAVVAGLAGLTVPVSGSAADTPTYVGSGFCAMCHQDIYYTQSATPHARMLTSARLAKLRGLPLPEGYTWDDIYLVLGGRNRIRYVGQDGNFVTKTGPNRDQLANNEYLVSSKTWVTGMTDEVVPYDCGSCHTSGYSETGNQGGKPGIVGSWVENGVVCETCHGPGSAHATTKDPSKIVKDTSAAACGRCHSVAPLDQIPAEGGFVRTGAQLNEISKSPHAWAECVQCHSPHDKTPAPVCGDCHGKVAESFEGSLLASTGMNCVGCHMPKVAKSARQFNANFADSRAHIFRINTDPAAPQLTVDGKYVEPYLGLAWACLGCHEDKNASWAAGVAVGIHGDSDADGLTGGDEAVLGTDPQDPDTDGDLASDGAEWQGGSDPLNPFSVPTPAGVVVVPTNPPFHEVPVLDDQKPIQ